MNGPRVFRKKPVEVEAMLLTADNLAEVYEWAFSHVANDVRLYEALQAIQVNTLDGKMLAQVGDWLIRGTRGEFYPCKPGPFSDTYEPVTDPNAEE